jgi:DNA-binding winged helix-turn-helix (wHTH) protein
MLLKTGGLCVFGPYRLDPRERQLVRDGQTVPLPPKAFDLLVALVARAGHLATKEELLAEVWPGTFVEEANLSYTISLLRKALRDEPERYIETVPKRGYRFRELVAPAGNVTIDGVPPAPPAQYVDALAPALVEADRRSHSHWAAGWNCMAGVPDNEHPRSSFRRSRCRPAHQLRWLGRCA